jgi:ATP-dependent Clp protease ATP-binding subunit ClpB
MDEIVRIVDLILAKTADKLREQNLSLSVTKEAKRFIAQESYSPVYGARPVRRYIQKHVETEIARILMRGEISEGGVLTMDAGPGGLTFRAG